MNEKIERDEFFLIPVNSQPKEIEVPTLIEARKKYVVVHVTFEGIDILGYADLLTDTTESKAYDESNDYL